ncbi:fumarylacetoacetase [Echinicola vietnamensis]|uniref:fumarylacetoacetase n=1 Tax=Echinicola vietnamensis (strain DSM 17526 / LMG 23754 / KMM 6221) TaxID=926556 RepID=L0G0A7_ECHVK|nr:fumarylacetoacetase [Echinicola vietnamensis]AGA78728.1 fumarylacetoacetase [Echinicola vietnamensis DSM 17526]
MKEQKVKPLKSWVQIPKNSDFTIYNLPFGVFRNKRLSPRIGMAIGDKIVDLHVLFCEGFFSSIHLPEEVFLKDSLNEFMALGKPMTRKVREMVQELLLEENTALKDHRARGKVMVNRKEAKMLMPVKVGDYTDFYSSKEHATNVGTMFRDPENALMPNWKHLPVGYHGRASSIVPSGTPIHRPKGQFKAPDAEKPSFGPSRRLDFELEMAFITSNPTKMGTSIRTQEAEEHIFGFVLFNDWSARDIQAWEYVPLGPFLGKSFASSISPWVVTLEALAPFRTKSPKPEEPLLPYLQCEQDHGFDIHLEVGIQPEGKQETIVCRSNYKYLYWNIAQQLAHQTVNGCNINVGDMYASGTISGPEESSFGSMLELAWKGTKPIRLDCGAERSFIEDGDTVTMRGYAEKDGVRVGFGEVSTAVMPSNGKG